VAGSSNAIARADTGSNGDLALVVVVAVGEEQDGSPAPGHASAIFPCSIWRIGRMCRHGGLAIEWGLLNFRLFTYQFQRCPALCCKPSLVLLERRRGLFPPRTDRLFAFLALLWLIRRA